MHKFVILLALLVSSSALAVTGNGTGGQTQVTGNGTGGSTQVTGNGTGGSVEVTGNGTGGSTQVTGNGTGGSTQVTGSGTGVESVDLDVCYTGSWYDPANPGEGISLEVHEDFYVMYFYDDNGQWLIFQGDDNGLDAYQVANDSTYRVGEGYVQAGENGTLELGFDLLLDIRLISRWRPSPWCLHTGCEEDFVFVQLTQPIPCPDSEETEVTGSGTGSSRQVTGNGTGSSKQVTGSGTGGSKQVTGNGTGSQTQVTGSGTGAPVTGSGTGSK